MSPNCRSASTSTTGRSERWASDDGQVGGDDRLAGAALGGEHGDDPAELAVGLDVRSATAGVGADTTRPAATRGHGLGQLRAARPGPASTSLTPRAAPRWSSSVVSSLVTMMAPDLAAGAEELLGRGQLGARRRTTGRAR